MAVAILAPLIADRPGRARLLRVALLGCLALTALLIAVRVALYRPLLPLPGARAQLLQAAALLVLYAVLILWGTGRAAWGAGSSLLRSTVLGAIAGMIQLTHLMLERFVALPGPWNGVVALSSMAITFAVWGVAAFAARRAGETTRRSLWMAIWSSIVTMTILVTAGVALELYLAPIPIESMRDWGEYKRSGWTDLHAFAIANTLDAAVSHLFVAPIVATVTGAIGYVLAGNRKEPSPTLG